MEPYYTDAFFWAKVIFKALIGICSIAAILLEQFGERKNAIPSWIQLTLSGAVIASIFSVIEEFANAKKDDLSEKQQAERFDANMERLELLTSQLIEAQNSIEAVDEGLKGINYPLQNLKLQISIGYPFSEYPSAFSEEVKAIWSRLEPTAGWPETLRLRESNPQWGALADQKYIEFHRTLQTSFVLWFCNSADDQDIDFSIGTRNPDSLDSCVRSLELVGDTLFVGFLLDVVASTSAQRRTPLSIWSMSHHWVNLIAYQLNPGSPGDRHGRLVTMRSTDYLFLFLPKLTMLPFSGDRIRFAHQQGTNTHFSLGEVEDIRDMLPAY